MKKKFLCLFALTICVPIISEEKWTNYLGNQVCNPYQYYQPKTVDELCSCVKNCASNGNKIRVVGGGYSISDLVCTNGTLLNLKNFNRILAVDRERKIVRVEAGITIRELNEHLACYDLALSNQAAIDSITLGGALATAVHGTGHTGTLSNFVRKIDMVAADGSIHDLSLRSDYDAFCAAKVSLGALGVNYAFTLQCEPLFYLLPSQQIVDIETLIKKYNEFYEANDFFQFTWNIESGKVIVDCWNRKSPQDSLPPEAKVCYKALTYYTIDENDNDLFSEIAIPMDRLPTVITRLKSFLRKYQNQNVNIADVVVRFVERDENSYLSPTSDRSMAYLTMSIPKVNNGMGFYEEFEKLMFEYQGRPHWGKINFLDFEKALKLYEKNLEKFISVKQRLDPQGVFSNQFIDRICKQEEY